MSYKKINSANGVKFETIPEEAPSLLKALIFPVGIPMLILIGISMPIGIIVTGLLGVWIYFLQKNENVTKYRKPSSFIVSPSGIEINGRVYEKENIHRFIMRNHLNEQYLVIPDQAINNNPISTARGLKLREKLTQVSYRVDAEANGVAIPLAGGLTEPTAYAILQDVSKILNA